MDPADDLVQAERLLDDALDAATLEFASVLIRRGGLEDDGDLAELLIGAQAVVELEPGHAWEADIEDEEVGRDLLERGEGLAGPRHVYREVALLVVDDGGKQLTDGTVVFDDDDDALAVERSHVHFSDPAGRRACVALTR